jgi:translation initiation factor 1
VWNGNEGWRKDMAKDKKSENRVVYSEFGDPRGICEAARSNSEATERATPDLPPAQQNLRVQASRKGRKGKTVTVITGLQASEATLTDLLKQLKSQCGAGGTVKETEIEIQGDHTQKLVQVLTKLGYKAKISGG